MLDMSVDDRPRSPRPKPQHSAEDSALAERYRLELQEREEQLNLMIQGAAAA